MATNEQPSKFQSQVCDNCRFRKTKCNRVYPCSTCVSAGIQCQYLHTLRRKGPRGGNGRRISQIKRGHLDLGQDKSKLGRRLVAADSLPTDAPRTRREQGGDGVHLRMGDSGATDDRRVSPQAATPHAVVQGVQIYTPNFSNNLAALDKQRLSIALAAHAQVFLRHLFPIIPVVDHDALMTDVWRLDELSPQRYAFILSLCAATRLQLRLDHTEERPEHLSWSDASLDSPLTGEGLLAAAEEARRQYNIVDDESLDGIVTPYFMFACYGDLEKHRHATFYLNQSISMALSMGLDHDATYNRLPEGDRETARRIFWLLYVTERTHALQHRRPVLLRSTIAKPQVVDTDHPIVMHDFVNHIRLFETLPCSLYEWQPTLADDYQPPRGVMICAAIGDKLCAVQPAESILESQRFDTLVTQQWLRVSMWRLAFGNRPNPAYSNGHMPTFTLPFQAGRNVMEALMSAGQSSKDCHGIAIEQKLFDIGMSVADTAVSSLPAVSGFELGPLDLLSAIIKSMSLMRGRPSHYVPQLLKRSQNALICASPMNDMDLKWLLEGDAPLAGNSDVAPCVAERLVEEDSTTPTEEDSGSVGSWHSEAELGILEPNAQPYAPLACDGPMMYGEELILNFNQEKRDECATVEPTP